MPDQAVVLLISPFVVGLVETAKRAGLPSERTGPASMIFAFALVALVMPDPTSREAALTAIAAGLAANGLYSQGKVLAASLSAHAA